MEGGEEREKKTAVGGQRVIRQPETSAGSIRPGGHALPWVLGGGVGEGQMMEGVFEPL